MIQRFRREDDVMYAGDIGDKHYAGCSCGWHIESQDKDSVDERVREHEHHPENLIH